jgi:uncharacterized protein YdaU (DUF1376 family)
MKPPAFQFYPDDFIGGTCDLSSEEVGAYIRLLCYQWSRGSIPDDPAKLARIAGASVTPDTLQKFPNGKNARLEFEREKQAEYRSEKSKAGKSGAEKRWHSHNTAIGLPLANTMANDSSPSPSPSSNNIITASAMPQQCEEVKKQDKKPSDPRFKQFIQIFAECYQEAFSEKWVMNGAKDGKSLSRLLKALPDLTAETWQEGIKWCQEIAAKPYSRAIVGHTGNLSAFCSNWSGIVAYSQTYQETK